MNEIERIEEVMVIIKTNHMCQDIDGDCTEQDRIDYRARFAALKAGASALREKAEREKGCEYCMLDSKTPHSAGHMYFSTTGKPAAYCPMCGKRLEVEHG